MKKSSDGSERSCDGGERVSELQLTLSLTYLLSPEHYGKWSFPLCNVMNNISSKCADEMTTCEHVVTPETINLPVISRF